jgi:hypothetical protein
MIDQIRLVTTTAADGREYDVARIWIGGIPFSADLTPHVERVVQRIAKAQGVHPIDARASAVGF